MNKSIVNIIKATFFATFVFASAANVSAGNKDRAGQAGSSQLLINPWARSSGWGDVSTANAIGLESMYMNVAGIAYTPKTELLFSRTNWLMGSGVSLNAFGFTQKVGESGVMGMSVMSINYGDIMITTVDLPEGGVGYFSPSYMNVTLAYAKKFSNSISGGLAVKIITEGIADAGSEGVALDAGIRYVSGEKDRLKFGIALKNVGPPMKYKGDGLSTRATLPNGSGLTIEQRTSNFELPSLLNIGLSYDFYANEDNRITLAGNFRSNSFTKDQIMAGIEYGFRKYFQVRAGYTYEDGINDPIQRTTVFTGPSAGFTLELPFNDKGSSISFDYSYRFTNPFGGSHSFGARINL
jgi:hypothetical protein